MKIVCASVVRDFAMYEKCVRGNPHCTDCDGVDFTVLTRYRSFTNY